MCSAGWFYRCAAHGAGLCARVWQCGISARNERKHDVRAEQVQGQVPRDGPKAERVSSC